MQDLKNGITNFQTKLLKWYKQHGRHDLPWRHTDSAYEILVSEIMLQQTQVETVLGRFYQPFLRRFPTLESLANAEIQEVMEEWQGLGYYRRAKYLHHTAQLASPKLPNIFEELISLPGIGKNTAHAVLAFAHHQPYPVMEANVKRILCRIFAIETPSDKQLWEYAFELLDSRNPFDYNQAMMDLGSMVCVPKAPRCDICPASNICLGRAKAENYPAPKPKKQVPIRKQQILVIQDANGLVYMRPRAGEFLHGLFEFVEIATDEAAIQLNGDMYLKLDWKLIGVVEQTYSHFKQHAEVYTLAYLGAHNQVNWHQKQALTGLPLSKKERKILKLL